MTKYATKDNCLDPETGILKNRLGISDPDVLEQTEADYATVRAYELAQNPLDGQFDLEYLKALHRHLFGDVYAWAGEIRTIDIAKGNSFFAHHAHIETAAKPIFEKLARENYLAGLDAQYFSERAAYYLSEINALHPFREGNGRAQREFINQLAYRNGFLIEWGNISQEAMVRASIDSLHDGDTTKFVALIYANLRENRRVGSC